MKTKYIAALVILASAASSAFATGALSDRASDIDRIVQGHGKPGDTAVAISNPAVSFEVLPDGRVRRVNATYGTSTILDPAYEALRLRRGR